MSNNILTFIDEPSITTFTPSVGFAGTQFTIQGDNLEDAETIYFIEAITNVSYFATFQKIDSGGSTVIQGTVPDIDSTKRDYIVRIENSLGSHDWCCFSPYQATRTNISNISGDDSKQVFDKLTINAEISDAPTNTQGFQVLDLDYKPAKIGNKLLVQCELSLQSNFWGSAVVALFKDSEAFPRKAWNFGLQGLNFGQVAKLTYVADIDTLSTQYWKVRIGRAAGTYPLIYLNRNSQTFNAYNGNTSSVMVITEIDN